MPGQTGCSDALHPDRPGSQPSVRGDPEVDPDCSTDYPETPLSLRNCNRPARRMRLRFRRNIPASDLLSNSNGEAPKFTGSTKGRRRPNAPSTSAYTWCSRKISTSSVGRRSRSASARDGEDILGDRENSWHYGSQSGLIVLGVRTCRSRASSDHTWLTMSWDVVTSRILPPIGKCSM